jgi:hypothetical protein
MATKKKKVLNNKIFTWLCIFILHVFLVFLRDSVFLYSMCFSYCFEMHQPEKERDLKSGRGLAMLQGSTRQHQFSGHIVVHVKQSALPTILKFYEFMICHEIPWRPASCPFEIFPGNSVSMVAYSGKHVVWNQFFIVIKFNYNV